MVRVLKRIRKSFEKAAFSQTTVAKTHKKNMKLKFNVKGRKFISISNFVILKKSSKSKVKDKVFTAFLIEVNSDSKKNKNKKKKKKNDEKKKDDKNNENDEDVERINVLLIVKKLFDQKNCKIIDFTKRVNDLKKNYVNVSNIQNFEKNEIISFANKKNVNEIFTLITKMYILA